MFGQQNQVSRGNEVQISEKSWLVTLVLLLIAPWGFYAFYLGNIKKGLIWLFTGGGLFIGTLLDLIKLYKEELKDAKGAFVRRK